MGQGLGYPPQVFTDSEYAANVSHTEEEELDHVEGNVKKIGSVKNVVKLFVDATLLIWEKS